ncbi:MULTISPECIES: type II and III secretion system protein family protein [unclassified Devosia]|uniref:type II and III secretion system protein family protein n=1 Tax=unclassified Devosia TaxID=196773 RepID=UPI0015546DA7|nr:MULTISPECIES: type II and III secretion system protein family protein [unclassified Devosia]
MISPAARFSRSALRRCLLPTLCAALLIPSAATAPVQAQDAQLSISAAAYGAVRSTTVALNKSLIVDLPAGVAEVIVSQPTVAAAIMRTRTRAIVQGIGGGDTNIFFLDDQGRTISVLDIKVLEEPSQVGNALEGALARVIPGSNIQVESVTLGQLGEEVNRVVLTGTVQSAEDRDRALEVAIQFAGDPKNVANIIDVAGAQQVMLQVTVSEINRNTAKELGINLAGTAVIGGVNLGFNNTTAGTNFTTNGATGNFPIANVNIDAEIRALETRGALRILAQPTLTAISGQTANFLAGGELPYYDLDDDGRRITNYKPYGVELDFTPIVKSNGQIGLKVETSVSEPQTDGSLSKRGASTSIELPAGTTLAIGGLLQERVSQGINQMPGLGNIPILGALFRSRQYQSQETELVILVTPYLVQPTHGTIAVPTDFSEPASDAEAVFLGKMEKMYGVGGRAEMRGGFSGSVGFMLD